MTDFRDLNSLIKFAGSNLPNMEQVREQMKGFNHLTKIDLLNGYYSLPIADKCLKYLCTNSANRCRNLIYKRAPQGLSSSPTYFQIAIERILDEITDQVDGAPVRPQVLNYIDDIFIYTKRPDSEYHWKVVKVVFTKLPSHGLKFRLDKTSFFVKAELILGIWTDQSFTWPDQQKLSVLRAWVPPPVRRPCRDI